MDISEWRQTLAAAFPRLAREGYEIVGEPTGRYNCIAYAAGDTNEWWWPTGGRYWPNYATRTQRMDSLVEVFGGLDYEPCDNSGLESGFEKIALYEREGRFEHAALQTRTGRWRSKMGQGPLIEHRRPESLVGGMYGNPTIHMRRQVPEGAPVRAKVVPPRGN